ncbi:MAG: TVP38/TMEM64 family protein [Deltaproteobacteria bacterium]|nr:TVP38/TMEM64 family protein [Deltaproteobacteria bacterium]
MTGKKAARLALLMAITAGIALALTYRDRFSAQNLESLVGELGIWAPLVYIGIYLVAPALFLPGSPLTLAGGALFGFAWGSLYTFVGAVGGSTLAFLIARFLAADWVEARAGGLALQIKQGVEREGWHFVAFVRLVPLFPFNLLNYALGLTRIPLGTYVLTSAICMLPGIFGYVYLGYAGREALLGGDDWVRKALLGLAVFAALVLLPTMIRRWRGSGGEKQPK